MFGNGTIKPGIDKEIPSKQKKWLLPGSSALPGNAMYIPDRYAITCGPFTILYIYTCVLNSVVLALQV